MRKVEVQQQPQNLSIPPSKTKPILTMILIMLLVLGSGWQINFSFTELIDGLPNMWELIVQLVPPNWAYFSEVTSPMLETIRMAVVGTTFGGLLAFPLSMLAAKKHLFFFVDNRTSKIYFKPYTNTSRTFISSVICCHLWYWTNSRNICVNVIFPRNYCKIIL